MNFTAEQLVKKGFKKNELGQWYKPSAISRKVVSPRVQNPKPQCDAVISLAGQGANEGQSKRRFVVRIIGRRVALLDPDNFAGGCKYLIDQLRYAGLIPDDRPEDIDLFTSQEKVATKAEEGTVLEILEIPKEHLRQIDAGAGA